MRTLAALVVCLFVAQGQTIKAQENAATKLLDHLAGQWVLTGTIAGKQTTHDIDAQWVLNREYVQLHEISRERNADGKPAYEAIIYISWEAKKQEYVCLWLDSTEGGGLSAEGLAHAKPAEASIPFVFVIPPSEIHTTFSYRQQTDSWRWTIDDVSKGKADRFADLTLTRAKAGADGERGR